jgi:maltooligosyltrehalose trehalohydrolase
MQDSAVVTHPIGAEYLHNGSTHVRIWAPAAGRAQIVVEGKGESAMQREDGGYFSATIAAGPGDRYRFRINDDERLYPDPASRFQPEGPHGPSEIVDAKAFAWSDGAWRGVLMPGQIAYELHVGTFTAEGTFAAAAQRLARLAETGITLLEMMPIAEFDGAFGWGYDGVDLFAPSHLYGTPDDVRRFVDAAHALGIGVILDVVYNHFGPCGNYLRAFSPDYFSDAYENEWGDAINFDGPNSGPVREFFIANAAYWIDEFHFDGLRLDATQQIFDRSDEHVIAAIGKRARAAAGRRSIVLIAENEPQDTRLVRPLNEGGYGLDGLWNDDFHHSAMVALTSRREAYYTDTHGQPQEFVSAAKYGYLFQGQQYYWQRNRRGTPAWGVRPSTFVGFLQNHDQVANSARGLRGHQLTSPGRWRAMTALLLLGPWTPMLFQGQEFSASAPFLYFADFDATLNAAIKKGRGEFLTQFPSIADSAIHDRLADPGDRRTFERCRLDWDEWDRHSEARALHADLLRLRRETAAFASADSLGVDGCVLSASAFAIRYFTPDHLADHVLIVNLGADLHRQSIADPLLAPPIDTDWAVAWSSEDPAYGGSAYGDLWPDDCWRIAGESAVVLRPGQRRDPRFGPKRRTA